MTARVPEVLERPKVYRTASHTVAMELCPEDAEILAQILAHYDVLSEQGRDDQAIGYVPEVWHHTLLDLLREKTLAAGHVDDEQLATRLDAKELAQVVRFGRPRS